MRHTYLHDHEQLSAFAKEAAEFLSDPAMISYTSATIEPGVLFAIRWGCGQDCVLVLRLDDNFESIIFGNIIETPEDEE